MFLFKGREAHSRSLVKAISWRLLGSLDTFILGFIFTGSARAAGAIAGTEVLTKMVLYYLHERAWAGVNWGFQKPVEEAPPADRQATLQEGTGLR
ncbi:DUF2061 domain-containing protein [Erythrobacter sp. LQ02-29]|uniref:DUF2061 domain-containing protein n=1 Tax=unclassified Erythrobacter TaxID=2633097 RepID=UPI001BFC08D7|nr:MULTISPECIES: DUF2061 domain-containing protein [unclassified Erythrobacter]MCP9221377.1 DUF2061 domain-containing protein [Erythrobacter sp. LQ02-29]QWC57290.1 DUF2061 domain-containing protein [Erythrobacter sp. 3-20A1M]